MADVTLNDIFPHLPEKEQNRILDAIEEVTEGAKALDHEMQPWRAWIHAAKTDRGVVTHVNANIFQRGEMRLWGITPTIADDGSPAVGVTEHRHLPELIAEEVARWTISLPVHDDRLAGALASLVGKRNAQAMVGHLRGEEDNRR
jgi:hypothetical protein